MIVLIDDEDRENEGDLAMAAEKLRRRPSTSWRNTRAFDLLAADGRTLRRAAPAADVAN